MNHSRFSGYIFLLSTLFFFSQTALSQPREFSASQLTTSSESQTENSQETNQSLLSDNPPQTLSQKKGGFLNVVMSLIIPGTGEWAMGHKGLGKVFIGADLLLWLGMFSSDQYVNTLQGDLEGFAAAHANVNTAGKGDQFWIDIGTQESIFAFNRQKLLERDIGATYSEGGEFDWQWDSEANRRVYLERRFNKIDWERTSNILVTGLVLNRIVSAIDVIRLIRKNKKAAEQNALGTNRKSYMRFNYAWNEHQGEVVRFNFTWLLN